MVNPAAGIAALAGMKARGERIACLTAYDASFAAILEAAGVDAVLVGDSLGMVLHGEQTTLHVRLADMIYHSRIVRRGLDRAPVIVDMPFASYTTPAQALGNAARLVSEGGAQAVKLEGGAALADTVQALTDAGIPVCGHLGMLPQSVLTTGGYKVQGSDPDARLQIEADARALEQAGICMLVLECVPPKLAARLSRALAVPVIGIGAGPECDGQVLVLYDLLGICPNPPAFSRDFLGTEGNVRTAVRSYVREVKAGDFPPPGQ